MHKLLDGQMLDEMRAFIRVFDSGCYAVAAEQMDLTQTQVTRLVDELEQRIGTRLLLRTDGRLVPTETGANHAERYRRVIALSAEADAIASGTATSPSGLLRVQCAASFAQRYVFPVIDEFCARYPGLDVECSTSLNTSDIIVRGIDVGIHLADTLTDPRGLGRKLGKTFMVLCASPAYVDEHGEPQSPDDLYRHACLRLVSPAISSDWKLIDRTGSETRLSLRNRMVADMPEMLLEVALRGQGIALLPAYSAIDSIRTGRLRRILPTWRSPDIGVYALGSARHDMDAKARAWLDWIVERIVPRLDSDNDFFLISTE